MPRYDVFLSHASADKPAVEHLAHKLRAEGIEPFLDKWHLVPGEPWQEALEEALDASHTCAVFIGKAWGSWQHEEMRSALDSRVKDNGFRVIPVLLPGGGEPGGEELPRFLRRLAWVDFRAGLDDEDAFSRLLAGIRGEAPGPGGKPPLPYRCLAPVRESFVRRREYEEAVQALLGGSTTLALQGAGGFGKTSLAIEICYDPRIRECFPDGILWAQMRDNLDSDGRLKEIRDLLRGWTQEEPPAFETVARAGQHLIGLLNGKRVLFVADDIWNLEDVAPFQGLSAESALLVTTRNSQTLPSETLRIRVDAMKTAEATELLGRKIQRDAEKLERLSVRLGEWPLLLKIVNRQLRELIAEGLSPEQAIREVEEAIEAEGLTAFDREESRHQAVRLTVGVSLGRLSAEDSFRFDQLAIFPEDEEIPLSVLTNLWDLGSFQVKRLCGRLHELSLLLRFDRQGETIRLHDVVRAYLLRKTLKELPAIHRRFLETFRPASGSWVDVSAAAVYLWRNLAHHLAGAGERDSYKDLLVDFDFLRSKIAAVGINAILADCGLFKDDAEIRLLGDALRLSSHVLEKYPGQLREQLWGRLRDREEPRIQNLLQRAREKSSAAWLQPRMASFAKPGGALIRTIEHPGVPEMLAVLDENRVISSCTDRMLRIWDLETGQILRVIEGDSFCAVAVAGDRRTIVSGTLKGSLRVVDLENEHALHFLERQAPFITALAVLDNGWVISGAMDRALRVWDLESGQELMVLKGHTGGITAVAALDRQRVVSGSLDGTLRVWEVETGQTLAVLEGHAGPVKAVAVLNSQQVVSGWANGTVQVWDVESRQALAILEGHPREVNAVAVLPHRRVISGSMDRKLRLWDVDNQQTLAVLEGHFNEVKAVAALSPQRIVSASADKTLRVWDLDRVQASGLAGHTGGVTAVAILDGRRMVSGAVDQTLRVWDIESGQPLAVLEGHLRRISAISVLDSRRVISISTDGMLRVWDVDSGQTLAVLPGIGGAEIFAVAVLDSRRALSGSSDGTLRLWDVEDGELLATFGGGPDILYAVAVVDRRRVLSGSYDGKVQLWDIDRGEAVTLFQDDSSAIYTVMVWDGRRAVSGFTDGTLRVHDIETGEVVASFNAHSAAVQSLARLDDRHLVSGSSDRTLRVWDLETGETECLVALDAPVLAVAVVPGTRILVAGDASGRVHFFDAVEA
jgi:WD40 repeat protein